MHESSLSTYLHIPSGFHNQRPCNGYRELYSGRNIDFILKNHYPIRPLFYFFGVAVRFDWIKIDVWLKLGALNFSSRPKLSLGSAHVKYGVWPRPNTTTATAAVRSLNKGLMSRTMVLHVRYNSWYISLPSSAKQQREMTKFCVVWRTWTPFAIFLNCYFGFIDVS